MRVASIGLLIAMGSAATGRLPAQAAGPVDPAVAPTVAATVQSETENFIIWPTAPSDRPTVIVIDLAAAKRIGAAIIATAIGEETFRDLIRDQWIVAAQENGDDWKVDLAPQGCLEKISDDVYFCTGSSIYSVTLKKKDGRVVRIGRSR